MLFSLQKISSNFCKFFINNSLLTAHFYERYSTVYLYTSAVFKFTLLRDLQDGRGVRPGYHLPPHEYTRNTSTRGTTPTEHLLNAGRRPHTSQKARNSPRTWVGQKKKGKTEKKEYAWDLHFWEGAVKEEKYPHTRKPLHWRRQQVAGGESSAVTKERAVTGVQRAKQRDSPTEDRGQPALTSPRGLSAHPPGRVGAGS